MCSSLELTCTSTALKRERVALWSVTNQNYVTEVMEDLGIISRILQLHYCIHLSGRIV